MEDKIFLWKTFKALIWGALISQKANVDKQRTLAIRTAQKEISDLEFQHKNTQIKSLKQKLVVERNKLC